MFYKFIDDYKEKLSNYGLVFKYIKWQYHLFRFTIIPFSVTAMVTYIAIISKKYFLAKISGIVFVLVSSFLIITYFVFINAAKKTIRRRYQIEPAGHLWRSVSYQDFSKKILMDYLKCRGWLNNGKLGILIDLLYKESERRKFPPLFLPGAIIALAIPVWDKVLEYLFKTGKSLNEVLAISGVALVGVFGIAILLGMFKPQFEEIKDGLINRQSQRMKEIARRLEQILLESPE